MIDNTKGPYSLHLTMDPAGEAKKYQYFENQTDSILIGYNN